MFCHEKTILYVQKELYNFFLRFDLHFTQAILARLYNLKTDVNFREIQYRPAEVWFMH